MKIEIGGFVIVHSVSQSTLTLFLVLELMCLLWIWSRLEKCDGQVADPIYAL